MRTLKLLKISVVGLLMSTAASAMVLSFEEDHSLPLVFVNFAIKAGATSDPIGQSGLTNFMAEMLLRGTQSRTKQQIDLALDQIGATLEVETRAEALLIRGSVLSSKLNDLLAIMTEIITQPNFPETEIKKLKSQVVSGILEELGNDSSLAARRFNQFLFRDHPYAKPVLGTIKDVEKLTRAQILAQYDHLFQKDYFLVVGTGDADSSQIGKWADNVGNLRTQATQKRPDGSNLTQISTPRNPERKRLIIVDKPDRTQTQIDAGQVGIQMTDPQYFALYLGNHAFGGRSFNTRLMQEIRVKRGWSYGASSRFQYGTQPRSWYVHLFPAEKDTANALAYSLKMIDELREQGISQEEFAFAQQALINNSGFMVNTPAKRVENKLLEKTLNLPDGFMKSYASELKKVSLEEVNSALKKFLHPDRITITVLGTAHNLKEKLASAAGVPAEKIEVVPYTQE